MMNLRPGLKRVLGSSVLVLLSLPALASTASADGGLLEGWLINGTAGAALPSDLEVSLMVQDQGGNFRPVRKVKVDERGEYRFVMEARGGYSYLVATRYQGIEYRSAPVTPNTSGTTTPVGLTIYETTDSDAALGIEAARTVLEPDPRSSSVCAIDSVVLVNKGDRVYVGDRQRIIDGKRVTVLFSWPDEAGQLQPMQGLNASDLVEDGDGFWDTTPILPGKHEVTYAYMVPMQNGAVNFTRVVDYPTRRFTVLVADTGERVYGGVLKKGDLVEMNGKRYQTFTGQNLASRRLISLRISGLPTIENKGISAIGVLIIGLAVAASALIVGLPIYVWRRWPGGDITLPSYADRERLIADLAELDDRFDDGEIGEEEYQAERAARHRRLLELWLARAEG